MAHHENIGLCMGAETSFQQLRTLDIERMSFLHDVAMPHTLESVTLRGIVLGGAVRLDKCKCATICPDVGEG